MNTPDWFPRVEVPGVEVTPEGKALMEKANSEYLLWRDMRVKAFMSLVHNGHKPYVRPSGAEVARRRAAGKRQRAARKLHR